MIKNECSYNLHTWKKKKILQFFIYDKENIGCSSIPKKYGIEALDVLENVHAGVFLIEAHNYAAIWHL